MHSIGNGLSLETDKNELSTTVLSLFFLSPWQPEVSLNKFQSTFQYAHLSVIESNLINKCYVINDDGLVLYACLFIGGSDVLSGVGMDDANDDENAVINGENDDNVVYAMKTRKTH